MASHPESVSLKPGTWLQCHHLEFCVLETVLAVAETGSFRKAGSLLGIDQSAVTRRVQKLEDILGVSLFERSVAGARLHRRVGISPQDRGSLLVSFWTRYGQRGPLVQLSAGACTLD